MDVNVIYILLPLLLGWIADRLLGDPLYLPHPIVGFGKIITWGEKRLNRGTKRMLKGATFSILLIAGSFALMYFILMGLAQINNWLNVVFSAIIVFYCLAGKTLIDEVKQVFIAVDSSVEEGRIQVARIVGRDTSALTPQQIRTAALAGILDCRFGGPNVYFGQMVDKPYIGNASKELTTADMQTAILINRKAEILMIVFIAICIFLIHILFK